MKPKLFLEHRITSSLSSQICKQKLKFHILWIWNRKVFARFFLRIRKEIRRKIYLTDDLSGSIKTGGLPQGQCNLMDLRPPSSFIAVSNPHQSGTNCRHLLLHTFGITVARSYFQLEPSYPAHQNQCIGEWEIVKLISIMEEWIVVRNPHHQDSAAAALSVAFFMRCDERSVVTSFN